MFSFRYNGDYNYHIIIDYRNYMTVSLYKSSNDECYSLVLGYAKNTYDHVDFDSKVINVDDLCE